MQHNKIVLLLTFGVFAGCSNAKQEELMDTQSATINAQTSELSAQSEKINYQAAELTAQAEKINAQQNEINFQEEQLIDLKMQLDQLESNEYTVQEGDSLSKIARQNNTNVNMLVNLNPWLKNKGIDLIYPNEVIKLN